MHMLYGLVWDRRQAASRERRLLAGKSLPCTRLTSVVRGIRPISEGQLPVLLVGVRPRPFAVVHRRQLRRRLKIIIAILKQSVIDKTCNRNRSCPVYPLKLFTPPGGLVRAAQ